VPFWLLLPPVMVGLLTFGALLKMPVLLVPLVASVVLLVQEVVTVVLKLVGSRVLPFVLTLFLVSPSPQ